MITNEMKMECDKRKEEIAKDVDFQTWIADIKCSMNMFKNVQEDRISIGNQAKITKEHKEQTLPENQQNWKISADQIRFNKLAIMARENIEADVKDRLEELIDNENYPIYNNFLKYITGMGPVMSAIVISRFRPENIYYVSNMYSYAGIVTGKDKLKKGEKSHFDTYLKAKLLGVLGTNFIKLSSEYALYYYAKRIQLINRDVNLVKEGKMSKVYNKPEEGKLPRLSAAHHHRMAIRYMIQQFVRDYYVGYRTIMNIPVVPGYAEEKLDLSHVGEDFVSWDKIQKWSKETPKEKSARRGECKTKLAEMKSVLQDLMTKYGYKKEAEDK